MCRTTCHDVNPEGKYILKLRLGIMYATERARERDLSINTNHSEPDVYYIHSENISYCHSGNNETTFVSHVHMYPSSPILLAICSVTYMHVSMISSPEICQGLGIAVIIYGGEPAETTTQEHSGTAVFTTKPEGVSTTTENDEYTSSSMINIVTPEHPTISPHLVREFPTVEASFLTILVIIVMVESVILVVITILWIKSKKSKAKVKVVEIHSKSE